MQELLNEIWKVIEPLPGWCSKEKAEWIAKQILQEKPTTLVELGVFGGRSLLSMGFAAHFNNTQDHRLKSQVYGIDPFSNEAAIEDMKEMVHVEWWSKEDLRKIHSECETALGENGLIGTVILLVEKSINAAPLFDNGSVDFLHIDANHSSEQSTLDVVTWLPKCREGALIVLDDIDWPSVELARIFLARECRVIHTMPTWEAFEKITASTLIV